MTASVAAAAACQAPPAWAIDVDNPYRDQIGIQLYTLRHSIAEDAMATIGKVAQLGFKQVESYGFPDCDPILEAAKHHGLPVHSTHFNSGPLVSGQKGEPFARMLEKAKRHGLTHLVIPYVGQPQRESLDDYKRIAHRCNQAAELAEAAGIELSYHNHAFEFQPLAQDRCGYDVLIEEFSEQMKFEVDVFWVQAAGVDPVRLMDQLSGRITQLHLKDLASDIPIPTYDAMPKEAFKEIGRGVVAIETIIERAQSVGVAHCHVEQDHSPNPMKSIQDSIEAIGKM